MQNTKTKVYLNVYELESFEGANKYLVPLGFGAYHSGVEIFGREYSFGYGDTSESGIFSIEPKTAPGCKYKESILIGETDYWHQQIEDILKKLGENFKANSYDIFTRNCNHFTKEFCKILTGNETPGYLTRLSSFGSLFRCLLPIDSNGQVRRETGTLTPTNNVFQGQGYQLIDDSGSQEALVDAPEIKEDYEIRRKYIAMKRNL